MSMDDNDFLAACASAERGGPSAFWPEARIVADAYDINPATGQTEQ
jgi:hypothetical protein